MTLLASPQQAPRPTRDQACARAGQLLAEAVARRDALTPEAAARAAYSPDAGPSIPELEARIRARRASTDDTLAVAS